MFDTWRTEWRQMRRDRTAQLRFLLWVIRGLAAVIVLGSIAVLFQHDGVEKLKEYLIAALAGVAALYSENNGLKRRMVRPLEDVEESSVDACAPSVLTTAAVLTFFTLHSTSRLVGAFCALVAAAYCIIEMYRHYRKPEDPLTWRVRLHLLTITVVLCFVAYWVGGVLGMISAGN